jgi:hypothetical protein
MMVNKCAKLQSHMSMDLYLRWYANLNIRGYIKANAPVTSIALLILIEIVELKISKKQGKLRHLTFKVKVIYE